MATAKPTEPAKKAPEHPAPERRGVPAERPKTPDTRPDHDNKPDRAPTQPDRKRSEP